MKRRILMIFLSIVSVLCLAFGVSACDKNKNNTSSSSESTVSGQSLDSNDEADTSSSGITSGDEVSPPDKSGDDGESSPDQTTGGSEESNPSEGEGNEPSEDGDSHTHGLKAVTATEATCTEAGNTAYWYCEDCGKYFSDANGETEISLSDTVIPSAGHTLIHIEAQAATCTEIGWEAYEYCSVCDYTTYKEISVLSHNYNSEGICTTCGAELVGSEGLAYTRSGETYSVSGIGECEATDIIIPLTYNNLPVTAIDNNVFENQTQITSIYIPYGVTSIGYRAFYNCTSLTSVTIGSGVKSIGIDAFYNCTSLENVYFTGTASQWASISFSYGNSNPLNNGGNLYLDGTLATDITLEGISSVGAYAFQHCTSLESVSIPDSITSIGSFAFYGCTLLKSISIPSGVESIGSYAFEYCTSLESVTLSNGIISIGDSAFWECTSITSITIPDSVKTIDEYAFYGCTSLESITIPDSVTSICSSSFYNTAYYNNTSNWDNGVLYIGNYLVKACNFSGEYEIKEGTIVIAAEAFDGCSSLESITIPNSVIYIGFLAFCRCSFTSITIPNSVTYIGSGAFEYCTSLTSITIGSGVTSIGEYGFYYCTALTEIYFNATAIDNLSSNIFTNAGQNGDGITVTIGANVTKIPASLFYSNSSSSAPKIDIVVFEENSICESIGDYAFYNCKNITNVIIPDSVISIGYKVFYGCDALIYYEYENGLYLGNDAVRYLTLVKIIDNTVNTFVINENTKNILDAFYGCTSLTNITIPDSVTSIGSYAFYGCTSLTSINIPDSVTSIGNNAFYNCTSLTEVYITDLIAWCNISFGDDYANPMYYATNVYQNGQIFTGDIVLSEKITVIPNSTFKNSAITSITIPDSVTYIGTGAFYGCTSLESITIGSGVKTISNNTFYGCTSLESIAIPDGVESIGQRAFYGCTSLESIAIPDGVPSIGYEAFNGCTSLESITIPSSVTEIDGYAFCGCTSLESITIGSGVTSIGQYAFAYCTALNSITIPNSVTYIGSEAFYNCTSLNSITIPNSVTYIGGEAFYGCSSLKRITIGSGVKSIGNWSFYNCTSLESVYYTGTASQWASIPFHHGFSHPLYYGGSLYLDGTLATDITLEGISAINDYTFYGCTSLKSVTIGSGVTSIGEYAFAYCTSLESVTIGSGVTSIGLAAFYNCTSLNSVTV